MRSPKVVILFSINQIMKIIAIVLLIVSVSCQACYNNSDMKYELTEEAYLVGYHSACSEFADRTCCSANNFDALRKRVLKYFANSPDTSPACRHVLSTLLCSTCDGDIGTKRKSFICPSYCRSMYQACKADYFLLDNNKLRTCQPEDPVCSTLGNILRPDEACKAFGFDTAVKKEKFMVEQDSECWDGSPSYLRLGKPKKRIIVDTYKHPKKSKISDNTKNILYMLGAIALATFGIIKYMRT